MDAFERGHPRALVLRGILVFRLPYKNRNLPAAPGLRLRAILRLVAALSLLLTSLPLSAQNSTAPEYLAKANYLANFPSFVDWPPEVLPSGNAPLLICVFGEFSFGTSLAEMTRGTTVHDRRLEIRWIHKPQELSSCHILFVSRSLDWVMPELDGPGVCREVRKRIEQSYVYMVLLTSKESKQDVVAGLESGADDYLTKPFDPEELKARLRTGLRILDLEDRLVEAREKMRFQATHDGLTTLWNSGVIVDLLGRELARSWREHVSTSILMCDLDHFKSVNDTYGHLAGDEVLKETAKRLLASVRSYDFVRRYGGEEFLLVLNNCNPAYTLARAEEIRKAIAQKPVPSSSGPVPITMSLGLLMSHEWGYRPAQELLQEADAALYAAKAAGRNCVRVARPKISSADSDSQPPEHIRLRR